ncbi:hypothetical protein [Thioalkalivibrio thiocyanodenitrificans]|uniref:hypothetical protein n=1 Tax=Thioalkalivibrio thiocyanodenitrificans TaxID=243063 RepID=UPI00037F1D6F|nr:hypothetical protein [Thioalkalivibrio thiocyanodenitrificans]
MRAWISGALLAVLTVWSAASAATEPRQLYVQPPVMAQVAEGLTEASSSARADFAGLVVEALIEVYAEELEHSGLERARGAGRERRLVRWRQAMEMELARLHRFRQALVTTGDVLVEVDRQGQVLLMVGGSPLLVSWPRVAGQADREMDLVQRYCTLHACPALGEAGASRGIARAGDVGGAWSMSQMHGPGWESEGGVRCAFADLRDRASREERCRALAADLESLSGVLAQVVREGGRIEWRMLRVEDDPGDGMQRLIVNERGDYLRLPLRALSVEPVNWPAALRWLERRATGVRSAETVLSTRF